MGSTLFSSFTQTANLLLDLPVSRSQFTLGDKFTIEGVGLFTGISVKMSVYPADVGHGIVFYRSDLDAYIPAHVDYVDKTPRCTILRDGEANVQTVEHVLSALRAMNIDNALIEIDGPEIPSADGSALLFIDQIQKVGVKGQDDAVAIRMLKEPVYWTKDETHIMAVPSEEYRISYTLSYPGHPMLDSQFYSVEVTPERYAADIAPCRTFSLYEEIMPLLEKGLIKGGSLDNGVIVKGNEVMNPGGARFHNEMVRHKMLDLIGDLSLVGFPFSAHIFAIRSGHFANASFAKELIHYFEKEDRAS